MEVYSERLSYPDGGIHHSVPIKAWVRIAIPPYPSWVFLFYGRNTECRAAASLEISPMLHDRLGYF